MGDCRPPVRRVRLVGGTPTSRVEQGPPGVAHLGWSTGDVVSRSPGSPRQTPLTHCRSHYPPIHHLRRSKRG